MNSWFPAAHLVLSLVIVIWDVVLAGRIAQLRQASRPFAAVTGLCGLAIGPAVLLRMATSTFITGRAVVAVDWIWPLVLILFAVQAGYAVSRRLVNPLWGLPIFAYNIIIAVVEVVRFGVAHGSPLAGSFAPLLTAQSSTLAVVTSSMAVTTPFFFLVPMIAPAFPALRRTTAAFRAFVAAVALGWVVLIGAIGSRAALQSRQALRTHADAQLRERPKGDFQVGLKVFPDIASRPSAAALENDIDLINRLGVRAVAVVFAPNADSVAIDSVARVLDRLGDSLTIIAAIGYNGKLVPELGHVPLDEPARLRTLGRIIRVLKPDIVLPAEDPLRVGARIVGDLPVERWQEYYTNASRTAKAADRSVRVGLSISRYGIADSILYAWAAKSGSPIDIVGFSFFPEKLGLDDIVASFEPAADRWMKTTPPVKDHWVFAAGAYPLNSGEEMQERAIFQTLAWATDHPAFKGLIVYEASDYAQARGLRAPNGRLRLGVRAVMQAIRGLRESAGG